MTGSIVTDTPQALRVLCVSSHIGSLNNVRPEAAWFIGLQQTGMRLTVMTEGDSVCAEQMREAGIEVLHTEIGTKFNINAIRKIRRTLLAGKHQIIHLFNNKAITNGILASLGLPIKVVTYRGQTGNIKRYDPTCYLTHLNPRVDCIVCVSDAVRKDLLEQGVPGQKLITIYKGHDPRWYEDIQPADLSGIGIPPDAFVVGCVANNRPRKGVRVLIESSRQIPSDRRIHFILVGRGMTSTEVRTQVSQSPLSDSFHLLDYTNDVLRLVASCDATVLPATKGEGLPKTVIESMALGVTPIVTSTGGSPELIVDGESGLVVPPADAGALARAITRVAEDPVLNQSMGIQARQRIASHFNLEQSVEGHRKLYQSLAGHAE
jgi:glycosyltransferase involved in cell wall biosynthesis